MEQRKLSIVITNFNYAEFIREAIASAFAVQHEPKEIIVVDDGSTDDSRAILASYGDTIKVILQDNGGQPSAANAAFAVATGEYLLFLDADDLLDPLVMKEVLAVWRDGVSKVQYPMLNMSRDGRLSGGMFPNFPAHYDPAWVREDVRHTCFYTSSPTSGNVISRAFAERIFPLPVGVTSGLDSFVNAAAPLLGDVITLQRPLGCYRIHGANSWALTSLEPKRFLFYMNDEMVRTEYILRLADAVGFKIDPEPLRHSTYHLQFRLVTKRLCPGEVGAPPEHTLTILSDALRATWRMRCGFAGRFALMGWFIGVALAPKPTTLWLAKIRFVQGARPKVVTKAMEMVGFRRATIA